MKFYAHRPGWVQPVGWSFQWSSFRRIESESGLEYMGVELKDFYLSHASALFLLQGASLKQLFDNVIVADDSHIHSLALADAPHLMDPPPRVPRVVLVHIMNQPAGLTQEQIFAKLFMYEMQNSSF